MSHNGIVPWEERSEFLISAKIPWQVFSELVRPTEASNPLLFHFIGDRLPFHLSRTFERSMGAEIVVHGWAYPTYSIVLEDETLYLRIIPHESGTEINLVPLASFVTAAIAAGVIGNLAYDVLKQLFVHTRSALTDTLEEWNRSGTGKMLDSEEENHLCNLVEIRLITPDGDRIATFDPVKGLPKETVEYLTRKIEKYREQH
jgi:hypothetical protein